MTRQDTHTRETRRPQGFTLLELIAVMGIIVAMSAIVVGGYRGMMRAIAQRTGVDALAKAITLCRQYATIDGKDTYFWITGFDTYVICRKAGQVDASTERVRNRPIEDYERSACGYLPKSGSFSAYWITDSYADLGSAEDYTRNMDEDAKEGAVEQMKEKTYNGGLVFDFTAGEVARIRYPAWFVASQGYWIIGLMGPDREDTPPGFKPSSEYGWMVGPEYQLPKGYVFDPGHYQYDKTSGEFKEGERFFFRPDGTPDENTTITLNEVGSEKKPFVTIRGDGTISWDYQDGK